MRKLSNSLGSRVFQKYSPFRYFWWNQHELFIITVRTVSIVRYVMRIIRCVRRNTGHFYYDDYIKTDFYVTSIVLPDRSPPISKILPLPLLLMKPARSLMDLYRTETYHKINIKYKFKTNSSNAFSMCVRSTLGKLLRHETPNKLLDRVIQARRRPQSQKADQGDRWV